MAGRLHKLTSLGSLGLAGLCMLVGLCVPIGSVLAGPAAGMPGARRASAAPLGGVNIPGLGPSSQPAQADRSVATARALHAKLVRVAVPWATLQPREPGGIEPHAMAFLDRLTADAAGAGIRVVMTVDSTPCWASSAPASLMRQCSPTRWTRANAWPPRDPSTYAAIVGFLAGRYGTRLAAIEIWNEPDQANQLYLAGPEKPQRYAAVLRAAYPAIKRGNPNVTVLAGSLVGSNGVFLRALYAAGIKGYYDGLAVHFYTLALASLRAIHETQMANGDSTPLWLDEFGWSSCWPRQRIQQEQACVNTRTQATNITNLFRSLAHTPYVAAATLYELQGSRSEDFGVLAANGARKPAFTALSRVLVAPFASPGRVTLSLRRRGAQVVASGSGPVGDYMQLEAFQGSVPRYRALFTLDRFNRYAIALPSALGTHGLTVRIYQYWAGVGRDAQRSI
jgi:polysaccharide biosynthesis protein PslG